jgi:hypothetical protein
LAIPRGGITDKHLLVCPIDCVPSRVHLSAESRSEEAKFCDAVQKMFFAENCAMLLFERALRTKNSRDHMQLHLLPIPFDKLSSTLQVFTESSQHHNIKFHEIDDEKSVEDAVLTMEGGPYQEYFYVEIPFDENQPLAKRKFVYVPDDANTKFPMFFGSEVIFTSLLAKVNFQCLIVFIAIVLPSVDWSEDDRTTRKGQLEKLYIE